MKKIAALFMVLCCAVFVLTGCSEADKVNANISKQATYFECERRVTTPIRRTTSISMITQCTWWKILLVLIPTPTTTRCSSIRKSCQMLRSGHKEVAYG